MLTFIRRQQHCDHHLAAEPNGVPHLCHDETGTAVMSSHLKSLKTASELDTSRPAPTAKCPPKQLFTQRGQSDTVDFGLIVQRLDLAGVWPVEVQPSKLISTHFQGH